MKIEFDLAKREWTLRKRGSDLAKAGSIFEAFTLTHEDEREDYGEERFVTYGILGGEMVACAALSAFERPEKMSERSTTSVDHDPDDGDLDDYDPDDAPILTAEMAARAQISIGGKVIREADPPLGTRRGRPPKPADERKVLVSLRLAPDIVKWFRATGPGWQSRMEELLRREVRSAAE